MIFSFSVPEDNPRFQKLISWYVSYNENSTKKMERSRDFREMFLPLIGGGDADVRVENEIVAPIVAETPPQRRSMANSDATLQPVNIVTVPLSEQEEDLDNELDSLTF